MRKIDSLRTYARRNPDKVIKIDYRKWAKARETIERTLRHSRSEQAKAADSASRIFLSV